MLGVWGSVKSSAKDIAKAAARQIAKEPLETLKEARRQVNGKEPSVLEKKEPDRKPEPSVNYDVAKRISQDKRYMQALEAEIADIRRQRQKELEKVRRQEELAKQELLSQKKEEPVPYVPSKPSRRLSLWVQGLGKGVETRRPPSG